MEVDFLLIGKGLTGQIKRYDYPRDKLRVTELTVESANEPVIVRPVLVFDVIQHKFDGKTYAVAGNDSNLLIVFYVQIMPDDFVMQLHRF